MNSEAPSSSLSWGMLRYVKLQRAHVTVTAAGRRESSMGGEVGGQWHTGVYQGPPVPLRTGLGTRTSPTLPT